MDGRVKTLHPRVHGGLLGRRGTDDAVMRQHGIEPIDLLVVNLYPFAATVARPDCSYDDGVENIDIGGPAMLRAAAKNHAHVAVVVDPADYGAVLAAARRTAAPTSRSASGSRRAPTRTPRATTRWSPTGSAARQPRRRRRFPETLDAALRQEARTCATARTRTSTAPSTPTPSRAAPASPRPGICRARSCRTTTSPTPTRRSSACGSSPSPPA